MKVEYTEALADDEADGAEVKAHEQLEEEVEGGKCQNAADLKLGTVALCVPFSLFFFLMGSLYKGTQSKQGVPLL